MDRGNRHSSYDAAISRYQDLQKCNRKCRRAKAANKASGININSSNCPKANRFQPQNNNQDSRNITVSVIPPSAIEDFCFKRAMAEQLAAETTRSSKCPGLYTNQASDSIWSTAEKSAWPKCPGSGTSLHSQDSSIISESSSTREEETSLHFIIQAFAENTTLHGIAHWLGPRHFNGWKKCAYLLVWLAFTGIMLFQLHSNLHNFFQYETRISFNLANAESLKFPGITICPESAFRKSVIGGSRLAIAAMSQITNALSQYSSTYMCYDPSLKESAEKFSSIEKIGAFVNQYKEREATKLLTLQVDDIFLLCGFKEKLFNCTDSWFGHSAVHGLCYTFNYANPLSLSPRSLTFPSDNYKTEVRKVTGGGTFSSLRLLLSVEKNESCMPSSGRSVGLHVDIHDTATIPIMPEKNIVVASGTRNVISLHEKRRNRAAVERHGTCTTDYPLYLFPDIPYSRSNCILQCLTEDIWEECHCINNYITLDLEYIAEQLNRNYHTHNVTDIHICFLNGTYQCMWPIVHDFVKNGTSRCHKLCPESCYVTTYDTQVSTVPFPADQVVPHMINITKFKTEKEVKENLVDLEIFFQTMQYQESVETDAISISDLFSNIGGTLGLYLGASFLTVVEVFDFLVSLLLLASCWRRNRD